MTYRQQQELLRTFRAEGYEITVKLNSKSEILAAEIARIESLIGQSSELLEATTLEAHYDLASDTTTVTTRIVNNGWLSEALATEATEEELELYEAMQCDEEAVEVSQPIDQSLTSVQAFSPIMILVGAFILSVIAVSIGTVKLLVVCSNFARPIVSGWTDYFYLGLVDIAEYLFGSDESIEIV